MFRSIRPAAGEFAPFYGLYISKVPDGDIVEGLIGGAEIAAALLSDVSEEVAMSAYAPGKWTLKEVVIHCADAERIFTYRALRVARGDTIDLPGFDENAYVPVSGANKRSMDSLLDEMQSVREASVTLFENLPEESWARRGSASGHPVSTRALAWISAGHFLHHLDIIQERYI